MGFDLKKFPWVDEVVGKKNDAGKPRFSLVPWDALTEIVRVLNKGAEKYAPGNWEFVPDARARYFDALIRHATAWQGGERNDPEWDLHHLGHAGCCLLFLLALDLRGRLQEPSKPGFRSGPEPSDPGKQALPKKVQGRRKNL